MFQTTNQLLWWSLWRCEDRFAITGDFKGGGRMAAFVFHGPLAAHLRHQRIRCRNIVRCGT